MNNRQKATTSFGKPKMNRDAVRMRDFNQRKWEQDPNADWNASREIEDRFEQTQFNPRSARQLQRNSTRTTKWKQAAQPLMPQPPRVESSQYTAKRESPGISEPMYDAGPIMGSMPIEQLYGANMDHSTFPLLVERTFRDMQAVDDRLNRKMPYYAFLYHYVTGLNANIIQVHQNENKDGGLRAEGDASAYLDQMTFPGPIADYFACLGEASTAGGEVVAMNIPPIAIPRATGDNESGTFGPITAENHNAYECYVARI
ncbi:hypothetical protein KPH14_007913 [Odynerus spinipes]|uniref:Uncharacterized protein n=1 Tax=Odynerus spinipes TaxID=1348599 RepID=A0AAD9VL50_9HYME|nr:hypothetical protein KPH14_007913 [Odynerus spinipes]